MRSPWVSLGEPRPTSARRPEGECGSHLVEDSQLPDQGLEAHGLGEPQSWLPSRSSTPHAFAGLIGQGTRLSSFVVLAPAP